MQNEKSIDDIIKTNPNLRVIANADELLQLNDDSYATLRHLGFGASDSSKLLGLNPFTTLNEMLIEKRNLAKPDPVIQFKSTVRKGKELENFIMKKAEKHLGVAIHKPKNMYGYKDTRLTVNFDGVFVHNNLLIPLEIKLCTTYGRKYYDFNEVLCESEDERNVNWATSVETLFKKRTTNEHKCGFPIYYYTQLQQQMMFLGAPFGILAVLDDYSWTMKYFLVMPNQYMQTEILEAEFKHRWNLHSEKEIMDMIKDKGQE